MGIDQCNHKQIKRNLTSTDILSFNQNNEKDVSPLEWKLCAQAQGSEKGTLQVEDSICKSIPL